MRSLLLATLPLLIAGPAAADDAFPAWRLDGGFTFSHFEQQVKVEIGGATGERLVTDTEFGVNLFFTWSPIRYLGLGLFAQLDTGTREMGRFEGVDDDGRTVTAGELGGAFTELWVGPLLRGQWRTLFVEVGYGFGTRMDEGRDDLPDKSGDTDGALLTSPTVAWLFAGGAGVPITESLQAVLRIEYRVRYYDRRTGGKLADRMVHGTQSLAPYAGVAWSF